MENHKSHIDPVCGMRVEKTDAAGMYEHEGVMYYFDNEECMRLFYQHPEQYAGKSGNEEFGDAPQGSEPGEEELKLSSFERRAVMYPQGVKRVKRS